MNRDDDGIVISEVIQRLYSDAGFRWPPAIADRVAPVPLDKLIQSYNLAHGEIAGLTRAKAGHYLARWEVQRPELLDDPSPLAGFLFTNANGGCILVNTDDQLPRRRFTAAHELGHYLLHFLPRLQAARDVETYLVEDDSGETVCERGTPDDDKELSLPVMERQANRFAAELLMPETVCRAASEQYGKAFRIKPRLLEHLLARDLLVSGTAMDVRLRSLGLKM